MNLYIQQNRQTSLQTEETLPFQYPGRTDGQTDRRTDGWTDRRRTDNWTDGRTNEQTDGQKDIQTDGRKNGWTGRFLFTPASRVEKPGAYSTPGKSSGRGVNKYIKIQ